MKNKKQIYIIVSVIFSFAAFAALYYLTVQHWGLKLGAVGGQSLCNISQKFNCDAVSASKYASLLGVPIALWGAMSFAAYLLFLSFGLLAASPSMLRHQFYLSNLFLIASLVMGIISVLFLNSFCLFCIAVYVCSLIIWFCAKNILDKKPTKEDFLSDMKDLFGKSKAYAVIYLAIPILSYAVQDASQGNALRQINEIKQVAAEEWKNAKTQNFEASPSIVIGASDADAKVVITEFADFLCPHCKFAVPTLKAFVYSKKDVQLRFYNFPLSSDCNDAIQSPQAMRCQLAMLVQCSEDLKGKGSDLMTNFFELQGQLNPSSAMDQAQKISGSTKEELQACLDLPETREKIKAQAKEGEKAGIRGTPAIFMNSKEVKYGARLPILDIIYTTIKN